MTDPRAELVGRGYDAMVDTWEEWKAQITGDPRNDWLDDLVSRLEPGARVIELGCGGGTEETALLAAQFELTGVDLSREQLRRARARIPQARFIEADFATMQFEPGSAEAVVAFYSFNHVPRELLGGLLGRLRDALVPRGLLLAAFGASDNPGWTGDWLGAEMFFSGFEPATNLRLVADAGLEVLREEVVTFREPEGPAQFHWVLAQR